MRPPGSARSGFTLLEVMLAVCVLALVGTAVYRFVATVLTAAQISTAAERDRALDTAFAAYLRRQMLALSSRRAEAIHGEPHRFGGVSCDELRWIARPGSGLLTRHAAGEWNVTLTARQGDDGTYELGLRRQDVEARQTPGWLPLLPGVRGFEVRYFDAGRREWLEKWTEAQRLPALVRVKFWRAPALRPYEIVLPVSAKTPPRGGAA
ncbi:MAG: type II secretion system protein GspJ [Verrucomicrobiota bacterium]